MWVSGDVTSLFLSNVDEKVPPIKVLRLWGIYRMHIQGVYLLGKNKHSMYLKGQNPFIRCSYTPNDVKVKVKFTLVQALRLCTGRTAHRGSRGIARPFHDHGTRRGEGSASVSGRSLHPGKGRYPLYRRLCRPQGRFRQVRKISFLPVFDPRIIQPVASRYAD